MTLKFDTLVEVVEIHATAKFYQAKCRCSRSWIIVVTSFLPYLAMVKNPKVRSCDLNLWPMTLKLSGCSVIVLTQKQRNKKNSLQKQYRRRYGRQ